MLEQYEYYEKMLEKADEEYPELEDRYCSVCGSRLVKGSYNYHEGVHIDGCE